MLDVIMSISVLSVVVCMWIVTWKVIKLNGQLLEELQEENHALLKVLKDFLESLKNEEKKEDKEDGD